jgi:GABA permease
MIVANQTLGGEELARTVRDRMAEGQSEFWVVVPATPLTHLEPAYLAVPVMGGMPAIRGSAAEAQEQAQANLDAALKQLRALGAVVDGEVGDPDPLRAATAAATGRSFDEIIVSTLPSRFSRWLRQDLPHRLEHKLRLPVIHVPSGPAPTPEPDQGAERGTGAAASGREAPD